MIGDEKYNAVKGIRDDLQRQLAESIDLTDEKRKHGQEFLVFMDTLLELHALPQNASQEEFLSKFTQVKDLLKSISDPSSKGRFAEFILNGGTKINEGEKT